MLYFIFPFVLWQRQELKHQLEVSVQFLPLGSSQASPSLKISTDVLKILQQLFLDFKTISSFICQNKMDAFGFKGSQNFTLKRLVLGEAFCHCCGPTLNSAHYPATRMLLSSSWAVQLGNWFYYSVPVKQFETAKLASFNMLCIRTHENIKIICTGKISL